MLQYNNSREYDTIWQNELVKNLLYASAENKPKTMTVFHMYAKVKQQIDMFCLAMNKVK